MADGLVGIVWLKYLSLPVPSSSSPVLGSCDTQQPVPLAVPSPPGAAPLPQAESGLTRGDQTAHVLLP